MSLISFYRTLLVLVCTTTCCEFCVYVVILLTKVGHLLMHFDAEAGFDAAELSYVWSTSKQVMLYFGIALVSFILLMVRIARELSVVEQTHARAVVADVVSPLVSNEVSIVPSRTADLRKAVHSTITVVPARPDAAWEIMSRRNEIRKERVADTNKNPATTSATIKFKPPPIMPITPDCAATAPRTLPQHTVEIVGTSKDTVDEHIDNPAPERTAKRPRADGDDMDAANVKESVQPATKTRRGKKRSVKAKGVRRGLKRSAEQACAVEALPGKKSK